MLEGMQKREKALGLIKPDNGAPRIRRSFHLNVARVNRIQIQASVHKHQGQGR